MCSIWARRCTRPQMELKGFKRVRIEAGRGAGRDIAA